MVNNNINDNALLQEWQVNDKGSSVQGWQLDNKFDNNDKFDNNKCKVCLLLRRYGWVGHMLDQILNHIIISLMTMIL